MQRSSETGSRAYWFLRSPPAGDAQPPHLHREHDQAWYVVEGELTVYVPGRSLVCPPGTSAYGPAGVPHTHRVTSPGPVKLLEVSSPAGYEGFVVEAGAPATDLRLPEEVGGSALDRAMSLTAQFGIEILGPPGTLP